jgi:hypothetical protein
MVCKRCTSDNHRAFNGEVAIHFPGLNGLKNPIVWAFPKLAVCLNCGFTEFIVPERELRVLVHGAPVEGALVLANSAVRLSDKAGDNPDSSATRA